MPAKKSATKGKKKEAAGPRRAAAPEVAFWEDDPGDPAVKPALAPITGAAPDQSAQPLPFKITGSTPPPKVYDTGTSKFRFYAAASALRRTADFWGSIVPSGTTWQVGNILQVFLDSGEDLNAFYTRGGGGDKAGLHFFHQAVSGRTYFSGESPDVVCHEMGHAVLDAIRPQLFNAQTIEAAAFHESFGDMSALLSAAQVPSFRDEVLNETGGTLNHNSRWSRLAEQLGAAIRIIQPDAVDRDSLRNAVNTFFYRDPQTLPPMAGASQLSSEPHSFSRVFTGAFLDSMAAMLVVETKKPDSDALLKISADAAHILVNAVLDAPVVPDYYSQVAAHMVDAGQAAPFNGKYRDAIKSAFVRRGILSLQAATTISATKTTPARRAALFAARKAAPAPVELPKATIAGSNYGLKSATLRVHTAEMAKRFAVTSSSLTLGPVEPRSPQNAAESFTEDLFQRGRVDSGKYAHPDTGFFHPMTIKTHFVVEEEGDLVLKRRMFDCGFD